MKPPAHFAAPAVLSLLALMGSHLTFVQAATQVGFDPVPPDTAYTLQNQAGTAATIEAGGPNGNYLRLLNGSGSSVNHLSIAQSDAGAFANIDASFNFRAGTVVNSANADGFGFLFLPTATYGTGSVPFTGITAEEPTLAGTLAVGVDFFNAINEFSVHWDGRLYTQRNIGNSSFLENGNFNNIRIQAQQVGNGGNITISSPTTGTVYLNTVVPNYVPYSNRAQISGRTGGQVMTAEFDNININYTGAAAAPGVIAATTLSQNFDSLGTTPYQQQLDATNAQGPVLATDGGANGAYLRLITDQVANANNQVAFDRAVDGGVGTSNSLSFDLRIGGAGDSADGLGVLFLPTTAQGNSGGGVTSSEEPNVAGVLGVGFDVHESGGEGPRSVSVHWNGATVASVNVDALGINLEDNIWRNARITTQSVAGGANVTVNVGGTNVITNQFVAGYVPYDYRAQFSARSGGLDGNVELDNIVSGRAQIAQTPGIIQQNFEGGGSEFKAFDTNAQGTNNVLNHPAIRTGGPTGNFLRLANLQGNQNAVAGFDTFVRNPSIGTQNLTASFDFRATADAGATQRADGFGFGLFSAASYGATGTIANPGNIPWERPAFANALTFGVDIYDANAGTTLDTLTAYYNGSVLGLVDFNGFDLNSDEFHRYQINLTSDPLNSNNSILNVSLREDVGGALFPIFTNLAVPGLNLAAYQFRPAFGARSGGAFADIDLDNFQLTIAPEPGRAILLTLAAFPVLMRRRRK